MKARGPSVAHGTPHGPRWYTGPTANRCPHDRGSTAATFYPIDRKSDQALRMTRIPGHPGGIPNQQTHTNTQSPTKLRARA